MSHLITATFKTRVAAEKAIAELENNGVTDEQISLVMTDETRGSSFNLQTGTKTDEGVATGAGVGGLLGVILGSLAAASTIVIPGVNLVVTGAIVSALAGLGAGAAAGGLVGGLIGAGIPEHEAKLYENAVKGGAVLLAVKPLNDAQKEIFTNILRRADAHHLAA